MPASFPTSIVTWTDVVDNTDTILASHMNNAYAEIIAIETVLDGLQAALDLIVGGA